MSKLLEYKCPSCGGALEFSSAEQKMKCPYCDSEFEVDTLKALDDELKNDRDDEMDWDTEPGGEWADGEADGMYVYSCDSCGGEVVGDETLGATSCPYCGNHVVMSRQFKGELKPDYVIPFKLDKKAAKEGFFKHLKGKRLLPKVFKSETHIDEIKGIYVPFWLFDAEAHAHMRYKATKVRRWSDANYIYKETSHYAVVREGDLGFERVPVDGSQKMPDDLMESLEPFDFKDAVDFRTAYLAGYFADRYDVDAQESIKRANERIKESAEQAMRDTVNGYATVITEHGNVKLENGHAKYALYPVWILNTTWKDQKYMFAMNGQTGKFVGNLPLDKGAYWRWLLGLTGVIAAAGSLVCWLISII